MHKNYQTSRLFKDSLKSYVQSCNLKGQLKRESNYFTFKDKERSVKQTNGLFKAIGKKNIKKVEEKLHIIRPLLLFTRSNSKQICQFWSLPTYPDSTNQEVNHLRNRVRKQLLPAIRFLFNPKADKAISLWGSSYR